MADKFYDILSSFPEQCREAFRLGAGVIIKNKIDKVVVAGMGGSAFAGDVLKAVVGRDLEVRVVKDYHIGSVDKNTLVFAISYSGNTEETLEAFKVAFESGAEIVGIGSGGKLEKACREAKAFFVKVPSGMPPRCSMGYLALPMLVVLSSNQLMPKVKDDLLLYELETLPLKEHGKKLADALEGSIPLIYSSDKLACLSYGWKTRINENSKIHAFAHTIPEMNHNELVGYTKPIGDFHALILEDKSDFDRVRKRYAITKELIESMGSKCTIFSIPGETTLSKIFCTLHIADWASYYLAKKYGVKPLPVEVIENLKKRLAE